MSKRPAVSGQPKAGSLTLFGEAVRTASPQPFGEAGGGRVSIGALWLNLVRQARVAEGF